MNNLQLVDLIFKRIGRGRPQGDIGIYRSAIQSFVNSCLQRLADRVAANDKLYTILHREYPLTLVSGEIAISNLSPTLLLSKESRKRWIVTMTGVRFPIKPLRSYIDILNPPPTLDYYFYIVHLGKLLVRDSSGAIPTETAVFLDGSYVPLISDAAFGTTGELLDDLLDIGVEMTLEAGNPLAAMMSGQQIDSAPSVAAQPRQG
jgi:hypothetical protein